MTTPTIKLKPQKAAPSLTIEREAQPQQDNNIPQQTQAVLITGGAGFLGINLTRYLLKRGYAVCSFDKEPFSYPESKQIKIIRGDIRNQKLLNEAMEGVDIVIHAAAALPLYSKRDIYTTDVQGTQNVLAAAHLNNVERVIHISSTAVYGIPDHHPLIETDQLIGVGPYGKAKIKAEKICEDYRRNGMCVSIIRPKSFIGPERLGIFALLYDWANTGHHFPMLGNGKNRYQLLDVEDLCQAIHLTMTLSIETVNDTFNIGAKNYTTMRKDYQVVLDEAGFGKRMVSFPEMPGIWALRVLEKLKISPIYKWVYETAGKDSFVSIEKAEKSLGFNPQFSNQDALLRNYHWYLKSRNRLSAQSGVSHRVPWKQGIISLLKVIF